ncbi:hypothetical protein CBW46_006355 [Paenibacillus xerothermodurans]|uniref:Uncharacterized protein n=1 Tax=Paenibacillus xerothermodurans TaxID=1977292 RepID=A0A2W1NDH3_PAEXE|nr:hypothetical protein CBW46_006355 [Paenibacillus xerothermodurans]
MPQPGSWAGDFIPLLAADMQHKKAVCAAEKGLFHIVVFLVLPVLPVLPSPRTLAKPPTAYLFYPIISLSPVLNEVAPMILSGIV